MINTMKNKQNLRIRITILYCVYFAALLGGIIYNSGADFKRGPKLGMSMANDNIASYLDEDDVQRASKLYIGVKTVDGNNKISLDLGDDKNTEITMTAPRYDIIVTQDYEGELSFSDVVFNAVGGSAAIYFASLAISVLYIAVIVLIFLILNSLHRSIKRDMPLASKCVWYTRAIGLLLIIINLLDAWGGWAMSNGAAQYFAGTEYTVDTSFPLNYYNIMLAVLVIFTAEIFSIGSKLGEEQKLTI